MLNDYTEIRECTYKGERYSVRNNGAVFRHEREGKRIRKNDDIWTFGKPNMNNGYMEFGSEKVHRIVAFAFLGEPPTPQHVVDHIDTNRRNNRPENLRWLTKLENSLNNPITRKKIEYLCGSVEVFISNPAIIQEFANKNPNYGWMRTVTAEEAKASYERLSKWVESNNGVKSSNESFGEWIYSPFDNNFQEEESLWRRSYPKTLEQKENLAFTESTEEYLTESLTKNAVQRSWVTPTEFPLCPSEIRENPLKDYLNNLKKRAVVTKNQYAKHFVDRFALCNENLLAITTYTHKQIKNYSMISVTYEKGKFVHEGRTFFERRGARKALTLAKGLEWKGRDGIDDYC